MNCYDFELNISAYIEGELKQVIRKDFIQHKEKCNQCAHKLVDISNMIINMPSLNSLKTSNKFMHKLNENTRKIDNESPSLWQHIIQIKPFGFEPIPAMVFLSAIIVIMSTSYFLLNHDRLPNVDLLKLSKQSPPQIPNTFKPAASPPVQSSFPSVATTDTSEKSKTHKRLDNRIKLVGGNGQE